MHFHISERANECLLELNMLRQAGILCDVTLRAGPDTFLAHRIVLASASPYFKAMLTTSGMRECKMTEVPLQGVKPKVLEALIEFAYTGDLEITQKNVCALLTAASLYQMPHVIDACTTFLEQEIDACNCIEIADFASAHACTRLYNRAKDFIFQHFTDVCQMEEYLQLSHSQLAQILRSDELKVNSELEVFDAVLRWVRYDEVRRSQRLDQLLAAVRLHLLPPSYIHQLMEHCQLLQHAPRACVELLERTLNDLSLHRPVVLKPRLPDTPKVVYVLGGYLHQSLGNVDSWNPESGSWSSLTSLDSPRYGMAACQIKNRIYLVGGRSNTQLGTSDSARVDCLDVGTNKWTRCSDMSDARNRLGAGILDGFIYAVGGSCERQHHSSVERYNVEEDVWSAVEPMSRARVGVGIAVVNRLMYAVGGYDGSDRLSTVERYHPENNQWSPVASMSYSRSGAGVCSFGQFIYACGGYDGTNQLSSVERYNVKTDQWETLAPMLQARSALCLAVISNKLYALGGYDGSQFLSSIECYDKSCDTWSEVPSPMCGRSGHGVTTGPQPST